MAKWQSGWHASANSQQTSWGNGKGWGQWQRWSSPKKQQKDRGPYIVCANGDCNHWAWADRNLSCCPKCNARFPTSQGDAGGVQPDDLSTLRVLQSYILAQGFESAHMREVHALISNILSGPTKADPPPKPQDPLATWKAARQRCGQAETALHRSETHNVVLVKRLEKAKAAVQDVEKQMLEAAATLKAAQSEHDEAHAALRGLPEPAQMEVSAPPVAASKEAVAPNMGLGDVLKSLVASMAPAATAGSASMETDEGDDEAPDDSQEVSRAQDDLAAAAKRLQEQKELADAKRRRTEAQTDAQAMAAQLAAAEQFKVQQEKQAKAVAEAAKLEAAGGHGGALPAAVSGSSG